MTAPAPLAPYIGTHRLFLMFAPSQKIPALETQQRQFIGAEEATKARRLLVGQILSEGACTIAGRKLDQAEAAAWRKYLAIHPEHHFCVILLDEDGTELRRDDAPLKLESILKAIDHRPAHG
ncbi:MAG TPA: DUF4174 domain-containing protein [Rhodothermales bacterium]|nr:DUF4174 domain-containing protein [Rhodothermales bacterium]